MPNASHDTTVPASLPTVAPQVDEWEAEVLSRLPNGWEQQAQTLGALRRSRQIRTPGDLLRGLLVYALCAPSFRQLGVWSVLSGLAEISETAWRKHLQRAEAWLSWLLGELLAMGACTTPWVIEKGLRRVLLLDGTHLRCLGKDGKIWRVHTAFDLLAGRLTEAQITDTSEGENWNRFSVQQGDLLISDRINGYQERIAWVVQQMAHLIVRCSPTALPLFDREGERIEVVKWLKRCHAPAGRVCCRVVWVHTEWLWVPVRLIALRLTAEQQRKAERRIHNKARQDKRKVVKPETVYLAGWLLVVTTLPARQWSAGEVLTLYRSRWHIELLFKRFKQLLRAHRVRCEQAGRARASILAQLVAWALQESEMVPVRLELQAAVREVQELAPCKLPPEPEQGQTGAISEWGLASLGLDLLRDQVRGHVSTSRLHLCLPRLRRFFCGGPRRRTHWSTQVCQWLCSASPEGTDVFFIC